MDKVTRQCPQTTTFLKRKESRRGIEPIGQTGSHVALEVQRSLLPLGLSYLRWLSSLCRHRAIKSMVTCCRQAHQFLLSLSGYQASLASIVFMLSSSWPPPPPPPMSTPLPPSPCVATVSDPHRLPANLTHRLEVLSSVTDLAISRYQA